MNDIEANTTTIATREEERNCNDNDNNSSSSDNNNNNSNDNHSKTYGSSSLPSVASTTSTASTLMSALLQGDDEDDQEEVQQEKGGVITNMLSGMMKTAKTALTTNHTATMSNYPTQQQQQRTRLQPQNSKSFFRKPSLTEAEEFVLHALLVDDNCKPVSDPIYENNDDGTQPLIEKKPLDDDALFNIPNNFVDWYLNDDDDLLQQQQQQRRKSKRQSIKGLWHAHEDGVHPKKLAQRGSLQRLPLLDQLSMHSDLLQDLDQQHSASNCSLLRQRNRSKNGLNSRNSLLSYSSSRGEGSSGFLDGGLAGDVIDEEEDETSVQSSETIPKEDHSDESSFDDDEDHEYDAWDVLKNEYAAEFGFDYNEKPGMFWDDDDEDTEPNTFRILGTTADDPTVQPHVLSPPLMDALCNFFPDSIRGENFWLKFSLVRDGASLDTLRRYTRAAKYTILAIETDKGEVFGSFTSSPWHTTFGYFGSAPCFVWKMRHSRRGRAGGKNKGAASLFDQAQLESEIDVFLFNNLKDPNDPMADFSEQYVQVSRHNFLAIGGDGNSNHKNSNGNLDEDDDLLPRVEEALDEIHSMKRNTSSSKRMSTDNLFNDSGPIPPIPARGDQQPKMHHRRTSSLSQMTPEDHPAKGFAIALEQDLLRGTTSPCVTFKNPSLCGRGDRTEVFYVAGIEVWTLTPCLDVDAAEKLEMTKHFMEQSLRNSSMMSNKSSDSASAYSSTSFRSDDLLQSRFYQRVGYDYDSQERRDRWQRSNMMESVASSGGTKVFGASPRFGS